MSGQAGSISPWRDENFADVGAAWWLLWRPSPDVSNASHWRFVAEFGCGLRPNVWVTAFTAAFRPRYDAGVDDGGEQPDQGPSVTTRRPIPMPRPSHGAVEQHPVPAVRRQVAGVTGDLGGVVRDLAVEADVAELDPDPPEQDRGVGIAVDIGVRVVLAVHGDPLAGRARRS